MKKEERDKLLIEEGKQSLRRNLIEILDKIETIPFDKRSISYTHVLGNYKEFYEKNLKNLRELGVDVSDITKQYQSTIKNYGLFR